MKSELDIALLLHDIPLFASFSSSELLPIARLVSPVSLTAGETLFQQGEFGDALYIIVSGCLEVIKDHQSVSKLFRPDSVGELAVLDWEPRNATVIADEDSSLLRLERNDLMDLLQNQPALLDSLILLLAQRLRDSG